MSALNAGKLYYSIKLHFNNEKYDAITYNFQISNRNLHDSYIYIFDKLNKKYKKELLYFYVSNFLIDSKIWINELLSDECETIYKNWKAKNESLTYHFKNDIMDILNDHDLNSVLLFKDIYPELLVRVFQGKTNLETLLMMNSSLKFLGNWNNRLKDDIVWEPFYLKCRKYYRFLKFNKEFVRSYLMEINK